MKITIETTVDAVLDEEREVMLVFSESRGCVRVLATFEAGDELAAERQRRGWQGILQYFKRHVETDGSGA